MKAQAVKQQNQKTAGRKPAATAPRLHAITPLSSPPLRAQRKSCACGGGCPRCQVQLKLAVSQPNDVYEQEADRVAENILRTPSSTIPPSHIAMGLRKVQTKLSDYSPAGEAGSQSEEIAPPIVHDVLRSPGQPLDLKTRAFFEPRFGHDFGNVRVHTDEKAAASARAVNALAYAVGPNVVFAAGQYAPRTDPGQHLLAHELAHVCQDARTSGDPPVRRYEGPEHQDIGDRYLRKLLAFLQTEEGARWASGMGYNRDDLVAQISRDPMQRGDRIHLPPRLNPQTGQVERGELTPGQVISLMGDFYGSVDDLANAPTAERRDILGVMERERTGAAPDAALQYEQITGGRYLTLAQRNDTHFARLNRQEWRRLHVQAIAEAEAAGHEQSEARFQRALLIDAAGAHFLTDAYAAGHLFDKSEVLASITLHLNAHPALTRNPEMQTYVGIIAASGRLPQLVLKNLHDRMNREGFVVTNARGLEWRTFGDNYLEVAQETQRVAALAVFLSRQQINAARAGQSPNPDDVEALMPDDNSVQKATLQAIAYIPDAVSAVESLIYRNRSLAPTQFGPILGAIVQSNLLAIGDPGRERQITEMLEGARRIGVQGPIVVPSFTLLEW